MGEETQKRIKVFQKMKAASAHDTEAAFIF